MKNKLFIISFLLLLPTLIFGQTFKLKGVVLNSLNEPIKKVFIVNTAKRKRQKITDYKGRFSLKVSLNDTLIMITPDEKLFKTVIKSKKSKKFVLVESGENKITNSETLKLIENSKREQYSAIFAKFKKTTITNFYNTIFDLLKAEIPDIELNEGSNIIYIRGTNSLSNNQPALIIVDGVKNFDIRNLNPQDVKSVKVIKDGTVGFYGGGATGGVIKITTKSGKNPL
jgi:hypothetical protein